MKILDNDEREAHISHITTEGAKGLFYGSLLSAGIFGYLKFRHPVRFSHFNTSIKACIFAMPTVGMGAFFADQGSLEFDRQLHTSDYEQKKLLDEYRSYSRLSASDKVFHFLNENKYKIIIGAWAGSLYGSWVLVNRDKIMTITQKAVQARMYAQGITIVLLISTILLAMKEEEINKSKPPPIPEWQKILNDKKEEENKRQKVKEIQERRSQEEKPEGAKEQAQ